MTKRKPSAFFYHLGIVTFEEGQFYVYDLNSDNKNDQKGNLARNTLTDYMRNKNLIGIYDTGATTGRIKSVAKMCWKGKYDKNYFNCQQFIDDITGKEIRSDLFSYYSPMFIGMGIIGLITILATINYFTPKQKL